MSKFSDALAAAGKRAPEKRSASDHQPKTRSTEVSAETRKHSVVDNPVSAEAAPATIARDHGDVPRRRGRPSGKRSSPDYQPTTAYVRKRTYLSVRRALMDEAEQSGEEREYSELVEQLLADWLTSR